MMKIVIDIPEEIKKKRDAGKVLSSMEIAMVCMAIKNGTQQPTDAVDRVTIKEYLDSYNDVPEINVGKIDKDTNVTTTDAVDRQAVNELVDELARAISDERCCMSRGRSTATIMQDILHLPSVTAQPCDDAISRQAVLEAIDVKAWEFCDFLIRNGRNDEQKPVSHFADNFRECVRDLPSVTPRPKMGRWIGVNAMVDTLMCSECGENIISEEFKSNYCPNCGAKMQEVENGKDND